MSSEGILIDKETLPLIYSYVCQWQREITEDGYPVIGIYWEYFDTWLQNALFIENVDSWKRGKLDLPKQYVDECHRQRSLQSFLL